MPDRRTGSEPQYSVFVIGDGISIGRDLAEELVWVSTTPCDDAVHNSRAQQ